MIDINKSGHEFLCSPIDRIVTKLEITNYNSFVKQVCVQCFTRKYNATDRVTDNHDTICNHPECFSSLRLPRSIVRQSR